MTTEKWTTLQFDSQILSSFMACPREMNNRFNKHLVPVGGISKSINKGSLAHYGLAKYYSMMKEGNTSENCRLAAIDEMKRLSPTLDLDGEDIILVHRTFNEYVEYRKNDIFNVEFIERHFKFLVYESYPIRIVLTGRIDLGITEPNSTQLIPIDHKSESEQWFYSTLSNQFKIYALACDSNELIVNRFGFQTTLKPEKKFKRERLAFDAGCLKEFRNEILPYYAKQMLIAMEDNFYPPNYTNCIKGHWGCIFSDRYAGGICNVAPELREQKTKLYFIEKEWDPEDDSL